MSRTRSPRVTVVMPAYNADRFIDEAIQSIRDQTLSDWELRIVNDGSTDNTADIAERHAKDDPHIRVLHQENAGQAAASHCLGRGSQRRLVEHSSTSQHKHGELENR